MHLVNLQADRYRQVHKVLLHFMHVTGIKSRLLTFLIPMKREHPLSKELSTFRVVTPVFAGPRVPVDVHQSIQLYNARDAINGVFAVTKRTLQSSYIQSHHSLS